MARVALALDDVGLAVPLQELLEAARHHVTWSPSLVVGPGALPPGGAPLDAVVTTDARGRELVSTLAAWRDLDPPPALLVVVTAAEGRQAAAAARAPSVAASAPPGAIAVAVERALLARWAGRLSPAYARGALRLARDPDPVRDAARIAAAARQVDFDLVREALRDHAGDYAATTPLFEQLRELRALEIPEVELGRRMDGAHTLKTVVRAAGNLGAQQTGRAVWGLASAGAVSLTPDPPDLSTPERRAVGMARRHLRARMARQERATHYDTLEVTPMSPASEIDQAVRMLAVRFSPERLQQLDLGDAAALVAPLWQAILRARSVLLDPADRLLHHDEVRARRAELSSVWTFGPYDLEKAEQATARGQRAMVSGEPFKAVAELATAARAHPDHPDFEATLALARFRAELARQKPREQAAPPERRHAAEWIFGRRPWPRALVAMAMLCAADQDADEARAHLREALECDSNLPAARQLLARLGGR